MIKNYALIAVVLVSVVGFSIYSISQPSSVVFPTTNKPALVLDAAVPELVGTDLLGRAEISYAGGTVERNKNIEIGVARIDGKVILPGEEFSFTKAIGPVTPLDGFSEAKTFLNGEVVRGLGGGLCQVSTSLFQTVLKAGLPVTERTNHSFTVSYYDVGLDATYSDPGPDLKFVNDTPEPIRIKGTTVDQKVVFEIYGTKDGRIASTTEAEITKVVDFPPTRYVATSTKIAHEQECINTPQIGYTATVVYGVEHPKGTTTQQIFSSTYKPLQRVCYISFEKAASMVKVPTR